MSLIHDLVDRHRQFFRSGATRELSFRLDALRKLETVLKAHEPEVLDALKADLNKSAFEAYATEVGLVYEELASLQKHLPRWAKTRRVPTPLLHVLSSSYLQPEPYGTVLILSPWNYPFQLTLLPLIGAVAAGNCCVVKPSAYSPRTSAILQVIVEEAFSPEHVSLVPGGRTVNQALLEETFDYLFFTGSPRVGRLVMEAAARTLTPVTLELGGKSPCIVDSSADLTLAAKRIIWGKLLNAGQTCIAPDYVLVHSSVKEALLSEFQKAIRSFFGDQPESHADYPKIINEKHFQRLLDLLQDGRIRFGGTFCADTLQIAPTLLDRVAPDSPLMQEEIFGPLLPVIPFETMEEVYDWISSRPRPLALYLFTRDRAVMNRTMSELSFGGGCINDTITHVANPHLPFGGVGSSGMGQYHGKQSFLTFTHQKGVLKKSNLIDVPLRYPPYRDHLSLLKKLM